jgi:Flp pilus assembly CpaF family ATPase
MGSHISALSTRNFESRGKISRQLRRLPPQSHDLRDDALEDIVVVFPIIQVSRRHWGMRETNTMTFSDRKTVLAV